MRETFEEYVARIESYLGRDDPFAVLRSTPGALRRVIRGVPNRRLAVRPAPRKWSAAEILAHLADTDLVWGYRIRKILEGRGAPLQGMDQEKWCRRLRYAAIPSSDSLATFEVLRHGNLALLERVSKGALRTWGTHSQFGRLTISRIVRMLAGHDRNHLGQIRAILAK
jgi:hypothetical protein